MLRKLAITCFLISPALSPAQSQLSVVPTTPDVSGQINAAIAAATPSPCPVPLPDTLTGSAGTAATCMPRSDATRPTIIQATTVLTAADGTFSGTWPVPFSSAPTFRSASVEITSAQNPPVDCSFIAGSVTATGFQGKCAQLISTTLPTVTTALLGLVISPITNAAAGQTVRIVGRQ